VALGRVEEAQAVAKHLMTLEPKFSLREYERTRQPLRSAEMAGKFMDRLREAGLPD
jgi:hypothetical protein